MIGKILLGVATFGAGAALSEETKGRLKTAARGVRDDLGAATKDVRARASTEWERVKRFVREDILEEDPPRRPPPASPPASA
ncbi:MAG: hypothetical protein Q8R16_04660 [bacterium]|nr:hypothetical protein [bacterium]